ncbi:response regulator, partial [Alcaligenes pakistanensis]
MRVLIVENDTTIAENLYTYLELKGFAVDAAYDGNGALALLQEHDFDALVLDLG